MTSEKVWLLYIESNECMIEDIIGLHRKISAAEKEKNKYYKNGKDVKIMPIILEDEDEDLK